MGLSKHMIIGPRRPHKNMVGGGRLLPRAHALEQRCWRVGAHAAEGRRKRGAEENGDERGAGLAGEKQIRQKSRGRLQWVYGLGSRVQDLGLRV